MTPSVDITGRYENSFVVTPQAANSSFHRRLLALRRLSARQDRAAARGRRFTLSRARMARELGFSRARMEQIDLMCRLRLLQALARRHPRVLAEMGASPRQIRFLSALHIAPGQARRLWQRWVRLSEE